MEQAHRSWTFWRTAGAPHRAIFRAAAARSSRPSAGPGAASLGHAGRRTAGAHALDHPRAAHVAEEAQRQTKADQDGRSYTHELCQALHQTAPPCSPRSFPRRPPVG
eukprot:5014189-Pyramimonas_sp.AAC.1